jgi:tripartite-type tricarboxylate transporter receptor subunit TctC
MLGDALAVTTVKRTSLLKGTPTLDESGLKGFDLTTWWGIMAPAKTPERVVARLFGETAKAMESPDVSERLRAMGSETRGLGSPAEFTAFVERERKTYAGLVKRSGATVD